MRIMIVIAFVGFVFGSFILFGISIIEIIDDFIKLFQSKEKYSLKNRIKNANDKKNKKGLKKLILETKEILRATDKENIFSTLCFISFCLLITGAIIAIIIDNIFLIPFIAIGFALIPFWYVKITATKWKKALNNELGTALSVITTSYMRSESIIVAIEENMVYIHPPVSDIFKGFLMQTKLINSNIKIALENLKPKIDSDVFHEWIDAIIDCQENRNLKSTLIPIVSKFSDMRIISAELDYLLYEPIKEFVSMVVLLIGNIPLIYLFNKDWFISLMFTTAGKLVLTFCGIVIFVSFAGVVRLTKPIEYKR